MIEKLPSRNEVIEKIELALADKLSREELSDWAFKISDDDMLDVTDDVVWQVLGSLVICDAYDLDGSYLYTDVSLIKWMSLLK